MKFTQFLKKLFTKNLAVKFAAIGLAIVLVLFLNTIANL